MTTALYDSLEALGESLVRPGGSMILLGDATGVSGLYSWEVLDADTARFFQWLDGVNASE